MKNIVLKVIIAIFIFIICSQFNTSIYAKSIETTNQNFSLKQLKGKTSFNCFIPTDIKKDWNTELKYPEQVQENMERVQIHFLNKAGTQLKVAIIESTAKSPDIALGEHGERVKIKNMNGVFHPLAPTKRIKDVQGGQLIWVQEGTMITLFSSRISKEELIKIAQSMQKI
ncbi:DUF4367 domain-containing protein [Bacillus pseudomycoides]|uniref:DUF4367 domain-containing protein n=1 Tax=Bacillus pseudomycoides TaxID=64104 RepID=UPI000BEB667B|nr:DUF4367 domain-containing protein [Bacillus pseudomycoides]PDY47451.1 hypothetical protein CON79_09325 [Bacillus pseudomycoides]PGE01854.1 hypothetical protein COM49_16730 [Bacillus pseudomycoides]PHG17364.1 hypothetical protein COI47_23335 [Bacillus pseudomycoides]